MVASIVSFRVRKRFGKKPPALNRKTLCRPAPFRPSEEGWHHANLKRPDRHRTVDEAKRKRHGRFAFERGALAERRD
jgi:hypothetical protein